VAVSVATVWRSPAAPRAVDRPALTNPVGVRAWLAALTVPLRRDLSNRADTQVLLGDRVVVLARSGSWAKVVVPDQPTPLDARGYPGWVPVTQLTGSAPAPSARTATVVARTAWLRSDDGGQRALVEISFGTRLPLVTAASGEVRVVVPGGRVMRIAAADVSVTRTGTPALPADGRALVRTVTMFTGLPYLWAGTSGFGFDCSGLTWLALRTHGVTIPRDASPQSVRGRPVPTSAVEPGDLLFFADAGMVHHVGVYAGSGRMTHAPGTGHGIETVSLSAPPYADGLVRARRYVG
jgi:cell wall-associated NlpC family hydrolase